MTLEYTVPLESNADVQAHLFSQTPGFKELVRSRVIIAVVIVSTFLALFLIGNRRRPSFFITGILVYALILFLGLKRIPGAIKKSIRSTCLKALKQQFEEKEYDGSVTFALEDSGVRLQGGEHVVTADYNDIARVSQEGDFVYLYQKDITKTFAIPLSAFATPEEQAEFISKARAALS